MSLKQGDKRYLSLPTPPVLVLDGEQRSALAAVRSLGQAGVTVAVASSSERAITFASRYAAENIVVPNPNSDPDNFLAIITDYLVRHPTAQILPMTDVTTMLLGTGLDDGLRYRAVLPPLLAYQHLSDKSKLVELASEIGIRTPKSHICLDSTSIIESAKALGWPVVVKPSRSRIRVGNAILSPSVRIFANRDELMRALPTLSWVAYVPALVQEYIVGRGAGVFCMYSGGQPVAWFAHQRLRERPPSGGVSVLSESAHSTPELIETTSRLLGHVGWTGVAMVEFKVDAMGRYFLIEVNGRFWGSLQLAIDSGVNFPCLLYSSHLGRALGPPPRYCEGQRLHWLVGDLDRLYMVFRENRASVSTQLSAVKDVLRSMLDPAARAEVLRTDDMGPGFAELRNWITRQQ